jgi:hypothetical protein
MIDRNADLTSRDAARSAPDGLTLSDVQRPERTRAKPPFCSPARSIGLAVSAARERIFGALILAFGNTW